MSKLELSFSRDFDFSIIKNLYSNPEDLSLAFPSASFPLVEKEWKSWIEKSDSDNYSLSINKDNEVISHVALKNYTSDPGLCYFCFFIIDQKYRSTGLARPILQLVYDFVKNHLNKNELWLVVDPSNLNAYNLYLKEEFLLVDKRAQGLRLKKNL